MPVQRKHHKKKSAKPDSLDLNVFYVSVHSIRNKFVDLEEIVLADNYDIIGITESWLNTEDRDYLAEYSLIFLGSQCLKRVE